MPHIKARKFYKRLTGYDFDDENSKTFIGTLYSKSKQELVFEIKNKIDIIIKIRKYYELELKTSEKELIELEKDFSEIKNKKNEDLFVDDGKEIEEIEKEIMQVEETIDVIKNIILTEENIIRLINKDVEKETLCINFTSFVGNVMQMDPKAATHLKTLMEEKEYIIEKIKTENKRLEEIKQKVETTRQQTELTKDLIFLEKRLKKIERMIELHKK